MTGQNFVFGSDILYRDDGSFDFTKIDETNVVNFWKEQSTRKNPGDSGSAAHTAVPYDLTLYEACQRWVHGVEDAGKVWEEYLYSGDRTLRQAWGASFDPDRPGLSVRLAQSLHRSPMLRSLFYYYYLKNGESEKPFARNSVERARFSQLLIEVIRGFLQDVWLSDLKERFELDYGAFFCMLESLFMDYDRLKSAAKKVRLNHCVDQQTALPVFAELNRKVDLMQSIADNSTRCLQSRLNNIDSVQRSKIFVDTFSPLWEKHVQSRKLQCESSALRFNDLISDILENLTTGEFHEAEKQKNQESGAKVRKIKAEMENEVTASSAVERFHHYRAIHESLDQTDENGKSGYDFAAAGGEDDFCPPEDYSRQIWETLSDAEKVLLITCSLRRVKSYVGIYGLLDTCFPDSKSNFIGINLGRKILNGITGSHYPEVKNGSKAVFEKELKRLRFENKTDFEYALQLLCHCTGRSWFDLNDDSFKRLYDCALLLCQRLNEHCEKKQQKKQAGMQSEEEDLL